MEGFQTSWYENGTKWFAGNCKNEKKEELWSQWYQSGQKKNEYKFKQDKLMQALVWKPNGDKCNEPNLVNGNGIFYEYKGAKRFSRRLKNG